MYAAGILLAQHSCSLQLWCMLLQHEHALIHDVRTSHRSIVELGSVWAAWRTWLAHQQALAAAGRALAQQARRLAQQRYLCAWQQLAQRLAWYRQQVLQADRARTARVLTAWQQVAVQAARWRGCLHVARCAAAGRALKAWQAAAAAQQQLKRRLLPLVMHKDSQLQAAALGHWKVWRVLALAQRLAWHMAGCYSHVSLLARSLQGWCQLAARGRLVRRRMMKPGGAGGDCAGVFLMHG
jgi:hypothetical protein